MQQSIESELKEAVLAAAGRADVGQAIASVYSTLSDAIALRQPVCKTSGRCCRFDEFGHRLYVTTMELATFVADMRAARATPEQTPHHMAGPESRHPLTVLPLNQLALLPDGGGCRFQSNGLCGAHGMRPFGCRIYFCDETSTEWQHETYERLHARIRSLHDELNVPYYYVEWRFALQVCL